MTVVDTPGGGIGVIGSNAGIYLGTHHTGGFQVNAAIARAAANNYHISGSAVGDLCIAGESTADIIIGTSAHAGAMDERIRIQSDGKIGIFDSSPVSKVTINNGTGDSQFVQLKNDNVGIFFGTYGTGHASYPREATINGSRTDSGSSPFLRIAGQGGIKFCVDLNSERMRIDTNGHILPGANGTQDLGENSSSRWRNIYGGTLSLTSYATIGAIVANDPGSSYYAYNNRIGGGMAIVGNTDLYGNAHVKGGDFRVRSETGAMSYQVVSGIKTFSASDTFVGLAYVGHSHSIQIQYMIVENNQFNLGGAHGELSMFTTYGNSSYTQNHSFRLNAMNGGRINGDPVFTYTNSSAGSHGNNYVLRAKVGYSGTDHNFTIRYVIRGLSSGNMYV